MHETYDSPIPSTSDSEHHPRRLGIIGGGQLARMTAIAALPLGVEVVVLERNPHSPAARLSPACRVGNWNDRPTLLEFAGECDVITLENEFVDSSALEILEAAGHKVYPSSRCLAVTQDKFTQKTVLREAGLAVPDFCAVDSQEDVIAAGRRFGWPLILKTRRNGYDGKGNFRLNYEGQVEAAWKALGSGSTPLMAEAFFPFVKELATIVTRSVDGETSVYPVVETVQHNHVCHIVRAPAQIPEELASQGAAVAKLAVETVGGVGSFGVEMFVTATGELAINELAPRVHNSGHYTIEACDCSQFENHVRAVLGWPLGNPLMIAPAAAMVNLLGKGISTGRPRGLDAALAMTGARVHIYGKLTSGPGRKMGHVTVLERSVERAQEIAEKAAALIKFGDAP